jgi:hypothetical protein
VRKLREIEGANLGKVAGDERTQPSAVRIPSRDIPGELLQKQRYPCPIYFAVFRGRNGKWMGCDNAGLPALLKKL